MPSRSLLHKPSSSQSLPWISPLQYLKPKPSPPSPPPPPPPTNPRRTRFISHAKAISLILKNPSPQSSLNLFNSLPSQPGFSHNHSTYSALLLRLARARLFPAVDAVLLRAAAEPCRFHESLLLSLAPFFARSSLHDKILDAFRLIPPITRAQPSNKALSVCLNLLVEAGRGDLVQRLLFDARNEFKMEVNTCVANVLVKFCIRGGDFASAFRVFEEMRGSERLRPNLITYSTLIKGLCGAGRLKDAFRLFEEMLERDRIAPDHLTYNLLIDGFCRRGSVEKARAILGFMRRNGCEPNKFNYTTLMNGFCREGRVEEAREVFDEMRSLGLERDVVCYTTIVSCLCRGGRVDEGIELVSEMGDKADVVTYNVLIEGLCKGGRVGEAMGVLGGTRFGDVRLNVASYRIVMNCLVGNGEVDGAVGLLGLMLGRRVLPHYAASNKLLVGLCEVERMVDAAVALLGLAEMGFLPESGTWLALVGSACRERKVKKVIELLDELVGGGAPPD